MDTIDNELPRRQDSFHQKTSNTYDQSLKNLVQVNLKDQDTFRILRETLTRIGTVSKDNTLWQICFIFHKRGNYYITHFKEMQRLDGERVFLAENDIAHRNAVIHLLVKWGMITVLYPVQVEEPQPSMAGLRVVKHEDKGNWSFMPLYQIGQRKH
jgi:hypothetical protein